MVMVLLSPRMVYALLEWPRMQRVAQEAGFAVKVWRDPRVPDAEWQEAVHASGQAEMLAAPPMPAPLATACGLLNHAPAAVVSWQGRVHPWPIQGVMPDAAWLAVLRARHQALLEGGALPEP
ncbi:MAG: hypothetical protein Q4G71_17535 [Pseudomonadota bacterium]|nr:hypothetical protein [Pseudomonadota bacterium]